MQLHSGFVPILGIGVSCWVELLSSTANTLAVVKSFLHLILGEIQSSGSEACNACLACRSLASVAPFTCTTQFPHHGARRSSDEVVPTSTRHARVRQHITGPHSFQGLLHADSLRSLRSQDRDAARQQRGLRTVPGSRRKKLSPSKFLRRMRVLDNNLTHIRPGSNGCRSLHRYLSGKCPKVADNPTHGFQV